MHTNRFPKALALFVAIMLGALGAGLAFADETRAGEAPVESTSLDVAAAGAFTITDESQLASLIPDENFRHAVFRAVSDGKDNAVGANATEALANFTGDIKASKKGIVDATGLSLLRKANVVDLRNNEISDFSRFGSNEESNEAKLNTWYGFTPGEYAALPDADDREATVNVDWRLDGNPFEKLPAHFGGRLAIEQPASHSYTYPEDLSGHIVAVRSVADTMSGTLNVAKTKIVDGDRERDAELLSVSRAVSMGGVPFDVEWTRGNDETAFVTGLVKSGKGFIAVGVNQELHYQTADTYGTITPGSQSFKYYLTPMFLVYDKVMVSDSSKGAAKLVKKDAADGTLLEGATYALHRQDGTLVKEGLTTDASGEIVVSDLEAGSYYFKETKAPEGYLVDQDARVDVTVPLQKTVLGGGLTCVEASDGRTVEASDGETFIAGPDEAGSSPDVVLTPAPGASVQAVTVTYAKVEGDVAGEGAEATARFEGADALARAQADINKRKNDNVVLGPVSVAVSYAADAQAGATTVTATDEKIELVEVSGIKTWIDHEDWTGGHPEITINLLRNGAKIDSMKLAANDGGTGTTVAYTFGMREKTDQYGAPYVYSVSEEPVQSTDGTGRTYVTSVNGFNITNAWYENELVNLKVGKSWTGDFNDAYGSRPATITIKLIRDGQPYQEAVLSAENQWSFSFDNLPKYQETAKGSAATLSVYALEEASVPEYRSSIPKIDFEDLFNGATLEVGIENTFTGSNATASLAGKKVWADGDDKHFKRPTSVNVELLRDGAATGHVQTVSANTAWGYAFEALDRYAADGTAFAYGVRELDVPQGYASVVSDDGATITNTLDKLFDETVDVTVRKTWRDEGFEDERPQSVIVTLLQDGVRLRTVELTEADGWEASVKGLAKVDDDGEEHVYTLAEDAVAGYELVDEVWDKGDAGQWTAVLTNENVNPHDPSQPDDPTIPDDPEKPGDPTTPDGTTKPGGAQTPKPLGVAGSNAKQLARTGDAAMGEAAGLAALAMAAAALAVVSVRRARRRL